MLGGSKSDLRIVRIVHAVEALQKHESICIRVNNHKHRQAANNILVKSIPEPLSVF
jgi:hypothetical protein